MTKRILKGDLGVIRKLKEKLATAHRILYVLRLADYLGHVSARVPGTETMLIKARGWIQGSLLDTTPRQIIAVDLDGRPLTKGQLPPVETKMHTVIYKARNDVRSIVHTHQIFTTAFGLAGREIMPLHINAGGASPEVLVSGISTFDRPNLISTDALGSEVAKALGAGGACHLRGHGVVVVGTTVEEAILRAVELEAQAKLNWMVSVLGRPNPLPPDSVRQFIKAYVRTGDEVPPAYRGAWNYYAKLVDRKAKYVKGRPSREAF